jgi:hypothetical protein
VLHPPIHLSLLDLMSTKYEAPPATCFLLRPNISSAPCSQTPHKSEIF